MRLVKGLKGITVNLDAFKYMIEDDDKSIEKGYPISQDDVFREAGIDNFIFNILNNNLKSNYVDLSQELSAYVNDINYYKKIIFDVKTYITKIHILQFDKLYKSGNDINVPKIEKTIKDCMEYRQKFKDIITEKLQGL